MVVGGGGYLLLSFILFCLKKFTQEFQRPRTCLTRKNVCVVGGGLKVKILHRFRGGYTHFRRGYTTFCGGYTMLTVNLVLALVQNYRLGFGFGLGPR